MNIVYTCCSNAV